jgi:nicotinamide-nucleotide amidase
MISIRDDKTYFRNVWKAPNTVDLVIITGGLGPTKDDITKKNILWFWWYLIVDEKVERHVIDLIQKVMNRPHLK